MVVNYRKVIAPVYYTCAVSASIPEVGTVTGGGKYLKDATVTISAAPGERATFVGWADENGDVFSESPTYTFTITEDTSLTALFVRLWTVATSVSPEDSGLTAGDGIYRDGQEVVLTASNMDSYVFAGWKDDTGTLVSTTPEYRFTIHSDRTFVAQFAVLCTVTILPGLEGAGSVTGAGQYPHGTEVTISANKNPGFVFNGWLNVDGTVISLDAEYTFIITGDATFIADFEAKQSRLPDGYTEVEYIESTGTQYINTGLSSSVAIKTTMDVLPLPGGGEKQSYFGLASGYQDTRNGGYYCNFYILWHNSTSNLVSIQNTASKSKPDSTYNKINSFESDKRVIVTLDGLTKTASVDEDTYKHNRDTGGSSGRIYLLANFYDTKIYDSSYRWPMTARLFSCQMIRSTGTVRDFVPCINPEGEVGLYDLIQGAFYANAGTGEFIAGSIV